MQKPTTTFEILRKNTVKTENTWKHNQLYRHLYNPEIWGMAYQNIYANDGSMTKGVNNNTVDGMSITRINRLIEEIKTEKFKPNPVRRTHIAKRNSKKKRPLGLPTFDDKLVQECIRLILESIYEPIFSEDSHGFRPHRSCHTALISIKKKSGGTKWWIEGDIKGFFDNINHDIIINIMKKKISDDRFLNLIKKFLKAGYIEDWKFHPTFGGTPQGGIISPLLANIYLHDFDQWIQTKICNFNMGKRRSHNPAYRNKEKRITKIHRLLDTTNDKNDRKVLVKELKLIKLKRRSIPSSDEFDPYFRRMTYTRYADDWLIGIVGSKEDVSKLKMEISDWLESNLKLELSPEKTLITHYKSTVLFLGYAIKAYTGSRFVINSLGVKKDGIAGKFGLFMPKRKGIEWGFRQGYIKQDGKTLMPKSVSKLMMFDDLEIIMHYNSTLRGLYNYYKLADNVCDLHIAKYFWKYSWAKTMGHKHKMSKPKVFKKYGFGKELGVQYKNKQGTHIRYLFNQPLAKDDGNAIYTDIDIEVPLFYSRTSLMTRLEAGKCEMCGKENIPLIMHHYKRIRNVKKTDNFIKWCISRNRKTIALCSDCHLEAHHGSFVAG